MKKSIKKLYKNTHTLFCLALLTLIFSPLAKAETFALPEDGSDIIGQVYVIESKRGESLESIGRKYDIGFHEMLEANPTVDVGRLSTGTRVVVPQQYILPPGPREGIVVNLPELRLYYFPKDRNEVVTFPVGLGRSGWRTPVTDTRVIDKEELPSWNVPKSIKAATLEKYGKVLPDIVPPGPENPLGNYLLRLGTSGYLIHGTNSPASVGKLMSSGCIRMRPESIEELYYQVPVGTRVRIINEPIKAGWMNNILYVESQMPFTDDDLGYSGDITAAIENATRDRNIDVDWARVDEIESGRTGIPESIGYVPHFAMH